MIPTPEIRMNPGDLLAAIKWNSDGLVPVIVQDHVSRDVLMMAWMDRSAVIATLATGQTHFYSRSRQAAWHKGGTSGHVQQVVELKLDCDGDTLLIIAQQVGGACHEGYHSCFFRSLGDTGLLQVTASKVFEAEAVYGTK